MDANLVEAREQERDAWHTLLAHYRDLNECHHASELAKRKREELEKSKNRWWLKNSHYNNLMRLQVAKDLQTAQALNDAGFRS